MNAKALSRSPWLFIPCLYLGSGMAAGGILGSMSAILFKDLGFSNVIVGLAALVCLPGSVRFLWAPWVDGLGTKRDLCGYFTVGLAVLACGLASAVWFSGGALIPVLCVLFAFSFVSSCLEVAADGYYIRVFDRPRQAEFVGVKATAIRLGIVVSLVVIVRLAGEWHEAGMAKTSAWAGSLVVAAAIFAALALYYRLALPFAPEDEPVRDKTPFPLRHIIVEYLKQERAWVIILLILFFRLGQGIQAYVVPAFLLDPGTAGGMGMTTKMIALLKTYTEIPATMAGGIIGGMIIKRFGLLRTIAPLTLLLNLPNFGFAWLAHTHPGGSLVFLGGHFNAVLFALTLCEGFCYGCGFSAFFYYIHAIATGPHRTSMLAISSGLMGLGFYLPGAVSGFLEQVAGYYPTFLIAGGIGLLTLLIVPFLPIPGFEPVSDRNNS